MSNFFINITGNMGVGATTLTRRLNEVMGWTVAYFEAEIDKSPFLARFYQMQNRWAFHNQMFYIVECIEDYQILIKTLERHQGVVCLDYMIYELKVYTKAMKIKGFLQEEEYSILEKTLNLLKPTLLNPDLLIYLTADINILIERIEKRGRSCETKIDTDYLKALQCSFDDFIKSWSKCPIIKIDSGTINFLEDDNVVKSIAAQVLDKTSACFVE